MKNQEVAETLAQRLAAVPRDRLAAIGETGSLSYGALIDRARVKAREIGPARQLVILESVVSIDWLVAYVAIHLGDHAALLVPQNAPAAPKLADVFAAGVEMRVETGFAPERLAERAPPMHPDLRLLLSTSGSTGSPKCVRLSDENLWSNAGSIATYLKIDSSDRGIVSLPVHYSYGMSIINSHLWAGATLLMTERSVIEPEFWDFARTHGATSFAGVPHSYDLLSRIDFGSVAPETLRYFTQAGGRLQAERVVELDAMARVHGWRFYVMYGQTEAAPRMAYLPPEMIPRHAGAIGVAIPGGTLSVRDETGRTLPAGEEGELVYEGRNVMMGYAWNAAELTDAAGPQILMTGDLARQSPDGVFTVTGRKSRFIKIFGNRIGLDEVETLCADAGLTAIATGIDGTLLVVTRNAAHKGAIIEHLAASLKLPVSSIEVRAVEEYPLLPTGKIDYAGLKASIRQGRSVPAPQSVRAIYAHHLGQVPADATANFKDLGGDSLTFVKVMLDLEEAFGPVPDDWSEIPMGDLQSILEAEGRPTASPEQKTRVLANADTLRAIACILVVMLHVFGDTPSDALRFAANSLWREPFELFDLLRMPLFTALAGVFFAAMPVGQEGFGVFARRRAMMLIVPAVVVSIINYTLKRDIGEASAPLWQELILGYLHLWYLYALFVIVMIVGGLDLVMRPGVWGWVGVMVAAVVLESILPPVEVLAFSAALRLMPFFILGVLIWRHPGILAQRSLILASTALACFGVALKLWGIQSGGDLLISEKLLLPLASMAMVFLAICFVPRLSWIEWIGVYSYTVYLWHPTANGAMRDLLLHFGLHDRMILFVLGTIVGIMAPIAFYHAIQGWPKLVRRSLIGR